MRRDAKLTVEKRAVLKNSNLANITAEEKTIQFSSVSVKSPCSQVKHPKFNTKKEKMVLLSAMDNKPNLKKKIIAKNVLQITLVSNFKPL